MNRMARALGAAALLAVAIPDSTRAGVLYVDDDGQAAVLECFGAPHRTIGNALRVARPGDEIRLCPGEYPEQVVLDRPVRLTGIPEGTVRPRIKPAVLPDSRPSLHGGNPVTAAILIDNEFVHISNVEVDLSNASVGACLPFLTGIYLRRASGTVERTRIIDVRVAGGPGCDSGVGLYVESGKVGEVLGRPIVAPARLALHDVEFAGYQKAGLVAAGSRTAVIVKGGRAVGAGPTDGAVQYGYQIGFGARASLTQVITSDHLSVRSGKASAGVLGFRAERVSVSKSEMSASQEGVLGIGDRVRVKRTHFSYLTGDGIVFLGDGNVAAANLIEGSGVSGVFANGNRNRVRGGVIRDQVLGVWFQNGIGNRFGGVRFERVPQAAQGVYGGIRWDMTEASADPFSTACLTAADCDDGNSCTTAVCREGHCELTTLAAGTACDDGVPCTTDVCDAAGLCQGTVVAPGTVCDDGNPCTTSDACDAAGTCVGTVAAAGTACDDGDGCTGGDTCNASVVCVGTPVTPGTPCDDGNACTLSDVCNFGGCLGTIAPTGTACDDGQPCTTGYCSSGSCLGTPEVPGTACDDGNACTANDACAAGAVCSGAPVADGTACGTMMSCTAGVCS